MERPIFLNATQMGSRVDGIDAVEHGATVLPENPFVGLRPFESKEAVLFFGRKDQTKTLLSILHTSRFVAVVGSSGCGKSSLIRAGLIPNLQAGFVAGSVDRWNIITMKPGNSPLQNLATALLHSFQEKSQPTEVDALVRDISLHGVSAVTSFLHKQTKGEKTNFLLLVDQFEEIFRFAAYDDADEKADSDQNKLSEQMKETRREEAGDFVSIMLDLVAQESIPVYVVMTMRSDFLGECDAFYGLPEAMNKSQYLVPRLTRQQRQQAIEKPVQFYGAAITERLTDRLLNDMEEERDQLPIMQHVLMRTWEKWQIKKGGPLDSPHYMEAGTLAEALSQDADDALKELSDDELIIAQRMFQALTTTDAKGRRLRRPTRLSELAAITGSMEVVLKLIERFRSHNRCFLMLSEDRDPLVDISHESLIRQWATLRKWVDDETDSRELYLRLANDAVRHTANLVPLWSDPALQLALNWWSERKPTEAWARRYHKEFKLTEKFLKDSEKKRDDVAKALQYLQDEQARREREDLERAQRQAEADKERAQELAEARQQELQMKEALYKQRAIAIRRTRLLALVLFVFLIGFALTAAWAWGAQAKAKRSAAEANDARSKLQERQDDLKRNQDALLTAYATLSNEKNKAYLAQMHAEEAKLEADRQTEIANSEKAKAVSALQKAKQTAKADKLRRDATNQQNAGEIEDAESTYRNAATAYQEIQDKEGVAYTYYEVGSMLIDQKEKIPPTLGPSQRSDREHWDKLAESNWVDHMLLGPPVGDAYFNSIGVTKDPARGLDYYAEAIKVYRQSDGDSGINGAAVVLEKVGDLMATTIFAPWGEEEAHDFAKKQQATAIRDSFCMALDNYKRADNSKRRIALLNKIGDGLQPSKGDAFDPEKNAWTGKLTDPEIGGCQGLGNDSATYFEESVKLYPNLLKKYSHGSNQFKNAQQSYVDLLLKVGKLYYRRATAGNGPLDQTNLNLAIEKFNKAAQVFRDERDLEKKVGTYLIIAENLPGGDLKTKYLELAVAEYHRIGNQDAEASVLARIGRDYSLHGRKSNSQATRAQDFKEAISYLMRALSIYEQQSKREEYWSIYEPLGFVYFSAKDYDQALAIYQTALSNSQGINDQKSLPRIYLGLGQLYEFKGVINEAKKYYEEVIRVTANDLENSNRAIAENALKRLHDGANAPKPEPSPTPQPSPTPVVGFVNVLWLGTILRMLLV